MRGASVPGAPLGQRQQRGPQRDAIRAEPIFRVCAGTGNGPPFDDARALELAQLLGHHLLRRTRHSAAQLPEAVRPLLQRPRDQRLPLAADHIQRGAHIAFFNFHGYCSACEPGA